MTPLADLQVPNEVAVLRQIDRGSAAPLQSSELVSVKRAECGHDDKHFCTISGLPKPKLSSRRPVKPSRSATIVPLKNRRVTPRPL